MLAATARGCMRGLIADIGSLWRGNGTHAYDLKKKEEKYMCRRRPNESEKIRYWRSKQICAVRDAKDREDQNSATPEYAATIDVAVSQPYECAAPSPLSLPSSLGIASSLGVPIALHELLRDAHH